MDYPASFDTPVFPAGKRIAISRAMAIGAVVAFFVISVLCVLVWWGARSRKLEPFVIYSDDIVGSWSVLGRRRDVISATQSSSQIVQESVIGNFVSNWFNISEDADTNADNWAICDNMYCRAGNGKMFVSGRCSIYCTSDASIFAGFSSDIVPLYGLYFDAGETFSVSKDGILITKMPTPNLWQVLFKVNSNIQGEIDFVGFVRLEQDMENYPQTMGYFIKEFNTYRLN